MSPHASIDLESTSALTQDGIAHTLENTTHSTTNGVSNSTQNGTTSNGTTDHLPELDASLLKTTLTTSPIAVPEPGSAEIRAQKTCTDHMITASWTAQGGWSAPHLKPYGPLSIMPSASCLHYATQCFEGLKLYRGFDGKLRLFRPERNCARMLVSSTRIALPGFDPAELLKMIVALCSVDGAKWLPKSRPGSFLYVRPTMIADDEALGVKMPDRALLYVLLCCFPEMDVSGGPQPGLKLLASMDDMVRAWPGGFGYAKVGANYGPSLLAQGEAKKRGFSQVLWLLGEECLVTEAGAANFFVVWKTREGEVQLVTAPLGDKIILDGVTRRSVLDLAQERLTIGWDDTAPLKIVERKFRMHEIVEAADEGRLIEAFTAGTAFFIAPISQIHFRGKDIGVPMSVGHSGHYTDVIKTWLKNIMYGKEAHPWGHIIEEV